MFRTEKIDLARLLRGHVCAGEVGHSGCALEGGRCALLDCGVALRLAWDRLETCEGIGQRQAVAALTLLQRIGHLEDRILEAEDRTLLCLDRLGRERAGHGDRPWREEN